MASRRSLKAFAVSVIAALALGACGSAEDSADGGVETSSNDTTSSETKTVTDLSGNEVEIPADPQRVIVTDNRSFQILQSWDVELVAAPIELMNESLHADYINDDSIINLGSHREPNMEGFVEAQPDLVINGQRFSSLEDDIKGLLPEGTAYVDVNMDESQPLGEYFRDQVTLLGEIFDKQDEAAELLADFDASIERAKAAYDSSETVMGLVVSGGSINYAAPGNGRSVGPLFPLLGLTPSLEQEGSSDHEGDEVSVEAIAATNPDWMIVLDRDQAVGTEDGAYTPSDEVIRGSEALKNVPAVVNDHVINAPAGFYVSEDVILYTEFINSIADAFEAAHN